MTASQDNRHSVLIELLDAYIDGELNREATSRVEAHLADCERCRRAVVLHRALRAQLAADSLPHASESLRERITASVGRVAAPHATARRMMVAWSGWVAAASIALAWGLQTFLPTTQTAAPVPMVHAAVADFGVRMAKELPAPDLASLKSGMPFPVVPLPSLEQQLLATWRTTIRGEPAAALAYRVGDRVVVQYVVSQRLFFEQPAVREAIAKEGHYLTQDRLVNVVAWPDRGNGVLLLGRVDTHVLESLRM